ncbi:MAG: RNA-binding cell elongation regulator Jag/EloR, partial [Candidatus Krumholzibacteriota bacterium]
GKTVEKALKKALDKISANINEVDVEIEDPGEKGFLGILGARDAEVKVTRKSRNAGVEEIANEIMKIILDCLDVKYRIFSETDGDSTYINIETVGVDGLLIGRKGDTLDSLQHLVGRIISKRLGGYRRMTLDVGGYLKNRYDIIRKKARKAAKKVRKTGRDTGLDPMKSSERRIAHIELTDENDISTYTVGSGRLRKVIVTPSKSEENRKKRSGR